MNNVIKASAALALGGALLAGSVSDSSARNWRPWAAAGAGFVAGAAIAGAAANANRGYYYQDGYAYEPGYSSYSYGEPYASGDVYVQPVPSYRYWSGRCQTDDGYGRRANCGGAQ